MKITNLILLFLASILMMGCSGVENNLTEIDNKIEESLATSVNDKAIQMTSGKIIKYFSNEGFEYEILDSSNKRYSVEFIELEVYDEDTSETNIDLLVESVNNKEVKRKPPTERYRHLMEEERYEYNFYDSLNYAFYTFRFTNILGEDFDMYHSDNLKQIIFEGKKR
jgi:hypothetical protein